MLRDIFKAISYKDSAYYDIYYLTDSEIRFSINDDRVGRVITTSVRLEEGKYIAYGFEKSQIVGCPAKRHARNEVKSIEEFWKWHSNFYNDLR